MVQVNTDISSVDEKGKAIEKQTLVEENHVLKSRLLEGGLVYSTFEEEKKKEEEEEGED